MSNPFADIVSVEVHDRYKPGDIVDVTARVPERFYRDTYNRADWEQAVKDGTVADLMENWFSQIDTEIELYGPDGQQVPLW